eukprot:scaffold22805_cov59-Phaeocystis_antarctica.AAC.3
MVMRHSQGDEENAWDEEAEDDGEEGAELHVEAGCDRKQGWWSVDCLLVTACRVFDPQHSLVPPSTATTPASVCVTCSREDISSDIAIFGVSSCLDMASLERDMRTGWGMKAHAEATRHASTRNSASGTRVWQSVSRRGGAELMVCESSVCVRCEQEACASQGSRGAEISVEAHSTFFVEERVSKKSVVMGFSACGISLRGKNGTRVAS